VIVGSREGKVYRYEPRENEAVNSCWMCDYGRLNYKWINREDRLSTVQVRKDGILERQSWTAAFSAICEKLKSAPKGSVAIVASARQTNEELYLVSKLAAKLEAITDCVPRIAESDKLLLNSDRNPNSAGAALLRVAASPMGSRLTKIS